ncbi:MAG: tRNA (adenosine(37)-N6)-dimethylallyltransferase MiaA [Bacteroidota bacterium]|nr:tRNA (adenosine(37)-N6)-dimethylallyltransferase MiaA [Bacteroidota bacterium]MDP4217848.1 tRNA (adenosine(37)-N6)-dimethylallyltransferase MiaA [Bacteroidota bacterium]MDP4247698.1 tRNA (adenosine(37)-N6)-dimethylallyltransferase MiaA [Bacteroidota bacterium]MDP4255400.1 tRNA (adenosine(37)-N6)-dimethylallyltransferase MiaA [Bacteroidota bacterium]MDP4257746.1 tRNA (adenosine(37)-N6)-dimethylallyltransferase MiaA [Bacteroidota bacterium]
MADKTLIFLVGPTAVGKTAAAVRLAKGLDTRIISADSRQCFKELNIGVAKPSPDELRAVPHYFIGSHSIFDEVTAALFEELSLQWAADIFRDAETAVAVGGTGLYIQALCEGLDAIPAIDATIRHDVRAQYEAKGMAWLQEQVRQEDPDFAQAGEMHNPQRLLRALEVRRSTGRSIFLFRTRVGKERPFRIRKIGLRLPKEELHRRIDTRVDRMMEEGLLEEVRGLLPHRDRNALRTVGYTELFDHLAGTITLDEAVARIKKNTRQYAKRQLTWFNRDPSIEWKDADRPLSIA